MLAAIQCARLKNGTESSSAIVTVEDMAWLSGVIVVGLIITTWLVVAVWLAVLV
jgi:hypothetical protein